MHVGCEYEGKEGIWASVEITKIQPDESVSDFRRSTRKRIQEKHSGAMGDNDLLEWRHKSPTGGRTYSIGFNRIRIGERRASIVAIGGDVDGRMITLILFDYAEETIVQKILAVASWQTIAHSRTTR